MAARRTRTAGTLLRMIQKVGEEPVKYSRKGDGEVTMPRREALARTLWARAVDDGDLACMKFLLECLDGKGDGGSAQAQPVRAEDLRAAEKLLADWWAGKTSPPRPPSPAGAGEGGG